MKDGRTRKVATKSARDGDGGFLATHAAWLVYASGPLAGSEVELEKARLVLGRSTDADVVLDHASVSHEHAALELGPRGFCVLDLGSTNGVLVNGAKTSAADLKNGDRLELGALSFRYVVEERPSAPRTHLLRED